MHIMYNLAPLKAPAKCYFRILFCNIILLHTITINHKNRSLIRNNWQYRPNLKDNLPDEKIFVITRHLFSK